MGRGNPTLNGGMANSRSQEGFAHVPPIDPSDMSPEDVDAARTREITAKAMTGILLLLLKWLRVSRKYPEHSNCTGDFSSASN